MAQGLFGMSVVIGPAIAPALGGYLAEAYDWRWIFYLIIPFCFAAFFLALAFVREGGRDAAVRLDWTGFLSLSVAIVCLQLMVDRGERLGWLESGQFIVYACLAALAFYMFLAHSMTAKEPFLKPTLFTDRNYTIGLVLVFVYGMLNFTPITLLPPMLQVLKGYPDSLIGVLLGMRGIGLDDTLGLTALSSEAHRQGMMIGYENAFLLYAIVCFATLPLLLLVRVKRG